MGESYSLQDELTLLDAEKIRLFVDDFQDLNVELEDGSCLKVATALRAFPVSAEHRFIVLRDVQGKEVGTIPDASLLDPESLEVLDEKLRVTYFMARITQINAIYEEFHIPKWEVETDRGPRDFEIGSTRRDIRILDRGRILIRDADGNRYEIPDYRELDPVSRSMIETMV